MNRLPLLLCLLLAACASPPPGPTEGASGVAAPAEGPPPDGTMDPDPGPPAELTDHPRLLFTAAGHDYGRREKRTKIAHTAVFYNGGKRPLEIREVKTHCGCAAALLSSKRIGPGERGQLEVVLDTGTLPGTRSKNVEVFTNDPVNPVAVYPISCEVIADAAVDPLMLVIRAARSAGPVEASFDVFTMRPGFDLEIRDVRPSHPQIRATVEPIPPGEDRTGFRVHLRFGEDFGSGDFHETVLVTTNSLRDPRLTMNLIGSVRQSVIAIPERLYFPHLVDGAAATRRLYVHRPDGRPLELTGVEDPLGLFEMTMTRRETSKWEVVLTLAGEAPARRVRGSVVVLTDAADEPRVAIPYEIPGAE